MPPTPSSPLSRRGQADGLHFFAHGDPGDVTQILKNYNHGVPPHACCQNALGTAYDVRHALDGLNARERRTYLGAFCRAVVAADMPWRSCPIRGDVAWSGYNAGHEWAWRRAGDAAIAEVVAAFQRGVPLRDCAREAVQADPVERHFLQRVEASRRGTWFRAFTLGVLGAAHAKADPERSREAASSAGVQAEA